MSTVMVATGAAADDPIDYVRCTNGPCQFYKRRTAPTHCRCAGMVMLASWHEDIRVRMLNEMADILGPERVLGKPELTTSGEVHEVSSVRSLDGGPPRIDRNSPSL